MDDRALEVQRLGNKLRSSEGLTPQEMMKYEALAGDLEGIGRVSELIAYCDLSLDEVCAENCVDCPHWDTCEYVPATVLPKLLNGLVQYIESDLDEASDAFGDEETVREFQEWVDLVYSVIARLKGEQYESAKDV